MNRKNAIRAMVQDLLEKKGDVRPLEDDESLFGAGRLQSIDGIEVVLFLEQEYGMDFSNLGFDRDAIDSVNAIDSLVEQHAK
jgi:acyl carrier protein